MAPRFPAPLQKWFHQGMTQTETSRHCKTCEQTVRCHRTAATPWALSHLPPTSQAFIVPRVPFTCFGLRSAWQHRLPTSPAASAPETFGELPSGLVDSGMRAGSTMQSPLPRTPGQRGGLGCSGVLAEHRRAAAFLVKAFTAHSRLLPAPAPASRAPRARGWVAAPGGWGSTNRLVEGGHREGKSAM